MAPSEQPDSPNPDPRHPEEQEHYALENIQPQEYNGILQRIASCLVHIRALLGRITTLLPGSLSWLSISTPIAQIRSAVDETLDGDLAVDAAEAVEQLEQRKEEFQEARHRLPQLAIEADSGVVRRYLGALQELFGQMSDRSPQDATERDFLALMGQVFSRARTHSPLISKPTADNPERPLTIHPGRASLQFEAEVDVPLSRLFAEALEPLSLDQLLLISRRLAGFLWNQQAVRYITDAEVRSQLPLFIEALGVAIEQEIGHKQVYDPDSPLPQHRLRTLEQVHSLAGTPETALPSRFANAVIDFLGEELATAQPFPSADVASQQRYQSNWEQRQTLVGPAIKLPEARNAHEEDGDRLLQAALPEGMDPIDFFDPAYYAAALASGASFADRTMVDVLKHSSLRELEDFVSERFGDLRWIKSFNDTWHIPKGMTSLQDYDFQKTVQRIILFGKPVSKTAYYSSSGGEQQKGDQEKLEDMELWHLYFALKRAFYQASSLQEALEILLPGVAFESLVAQDKGADHQLPHLKSRFEDLTKASYEYFGATGAQNIRLFMDITLKGLASLSAGEWISTGRFQQLKAFASSSMLEHYPQLEESVTEYVAKKYEDLSSSPGSVRSEHTTATRVGALVKALIKESVGLRLGLLEHLAQLEPRIRDQEGFIMPDVAGDLPFGEAIAAVTATRIFFVREGIINLAIYPLPRFQLAGQLSQ